MRFKRKNVGVLIVIMMMVSVLMLSGCANKANDAKDEEKDASVDVETQEEAESQDENDTEAEAIVPETEKTEWGSDEYGYVTLSEDWNTFITEDLSAEQNANMLQWQSKKTGDIVTLSSGPNSPEEIIKGVASTEEPDTYALDVYGEDGDDYKIGYFGKWYEDEGLYLIVYTLATDYSDKTYYFAYEGTDYENEDDFSVAAHAVFFTHSEFKKTSLYRDLTGSDLTDSDLDSSASSGKVDVSNYKAGDKYPLYDFITDELIVEATIPEGFYPDGEYCEKDLLVLDKEGTLTNIWITGNVDFDVEEYLKTGHLNDEVYGNYSNVSANMVEEYTLSNGIKVYALEIKFRDDEYDLDIHRYAVSIQKSDEIGVSLSILDDEMKELGFKTIGDLLDALFPNE